MLKGSTPVRLSQLDVSPMARAAKMVEASNVSLAESFDKSITAFQDKQQEKKDKELTIQALQELVPGLDDLVYNAAANDEDVKKSLIERGNALQKQDLTLKSITGTGGESVYTYNGEVINPKNVIGARGVVGDGVGIGGFATEDNKPYLIPATQGDNPDTEEVETDFIISPAREVQGGIGQEGQGLIYYDQRTNTQEQMPANAMVMDSGTNKIVQDRIIKNYKNYQDTMKSVNQLNQYVDIRGKMDEAGSQRLVNYYLGKFNTFVGKPLTFQQMISGEGKALFRSLLGQNRLSILGPGVMTEFDRQVIEEALGGFGPTSNPATVARILKRVVDKKLSDAKLGAVEYNRDIQLSPRYGANVGNFPIDMKTFDTAAERPTIINYTNDFGTIDEANAEALRMGLASFAYGIDDETGGPAYYRPE